ncbi:hypothetical protein PAXRUDRAFT_785769 [Paxillus rubicundulus Ve08.2h10]|uniref:Uncharacterized protein n=1 Tax=Paxillus rubicundulus Ve08.2h10 TaxID=930991 RepID=A0A0D0D9U5_9AGAM|nr:hypothetical protein PAXRUDRAFT_785769 [Paxillus rubicundulus Ve08.2h10]
MESPPNVKGAVIRLTNGVKDCFYKLFPSGRETWLTVTKVPHLEWRLRCCRALIEDNDKGKLEGSEEYIERTRILEEIWAPDGPMAECNHRMDRVFADLEKTLMGNAQSNKKPPWPLQQASMAEEIERIQVYKKAITAAVHADFCELWLHILESSEKQRQARTCRWIFDDKLGLASWFSRKFVRIAQGTRPTVHSDAVIDHVITGSLEEEERKEKQKRNEYSDVSEAEELSPTALTYQEPHPDGLLVFIHREPPRSSHPSLPNSSELRSRTSRPPSLTLFSALAEKNVRLLVTSRPEPVILAQYQGHPTINLEEYLKHASKDICKSLIEQMMADIRLQSIVPARKQKLADSMTQKSDGSTVGQVHEMVAGLPEHFDKSLAVRWLGGTLHPMSISQVIKAVKIELRATILDDDLTIVSEGDSLMICGDLVRLDERTPSVGLGHSSGSKLGLKKHSLPIHGAGILHTITTQG